MLWATSPACTELESHMLDWLVHMLDLPQKFLSTEQRRRSDPGHGFERFAYAHCWRRGSGRRISLAMPAAAMERWWPTLPRRRIRRWRRTRRSPGSGENICARSRWMRILPCARGAGRQIEQDPPGLVPFFVSATVGTTSSNAIDPVPEIGRICRENNLWLHVDAAMSGTAALCPEFRHIHAGLEFADSYCFNPHKWMFTNFDCDCFYVADRKALIQTLSVLPEYLRNKATETGAVIDYRDWQIPLGRRFRSLKLWFVIRHYGVEGLQHHIRQHVELAQNFAAWVKQDDRFELAAPRR